MKFIHNSKSILNDDGLPWTPLPKQEAFLNDFKSPFCLFVGAQGAGKTVIGSLKHVILQLLNGIDEEGKKTCHCSIAVAPTEKAVNQLCILSIKRWLNKMNIDYVYYKKSKIIKIKPLSTKSEDNLMYFFSAVGCEDTIVGYNASHAWIEECQSMTMDNIHVDRDPVMQTNERVRRGKYQQVNMTGTTQVVNNRFYQYAKKAMAGEPDYSMHHSTSYENPYIADKVAVKERTLDANQRRILLMGEFLDLSGTRAYIHFTDAKAPHGNVDDNLEIDTSLPLHISIDMGLSSGNALVLGQQHTNGNLVALYEFQRPQLNTDQAMHELGAMLKTNNWSFPKIILFGDSNGRANQSAATYSDFLIMKSHCYRWGYDKQRTEIRVPFQNPRQRERVNAANVLFRDLENNRKYFVHSRCSGLIKDYNEVQWDVNSNNLVKGELSHFSDAETYRIFELCEIKSPEFNQDQQEPPTFLL